MAGPPPPNSPNPGDKGVSAEKMRMRMKANPPLWSRLKKPAAYTFPLRAEGEGRVSSHSHPNVLDPISL